MVAISQQQSMSDFPRWAHHLISTSRIMRYKQSKSDAPTARKTRPSVCVTCIRTVPPRSSSSSGSPQSYKLSQWRQSSHEGKKTAPFPDNRCAWSSERTNSQCPVLLMYQSPTRGRQGKPLAFNVFARATSGLPNRIHTLYEPFHKSQLLGPIFSTAHHTSTPWVLTEWTPEHTRKPEVIIVAEREGIEEWPLT